VYSVRPHPGAVRVDLARGLKPQREKDAMKNVKRISRVTIKRLTDNDPDTSYLGHYSNRAETDYAIDRKHSLDCPINNVPTEGLEALSRVMHYLTALTYEACPFSEDGTWHDVSDAQDLLIEKQDELQECDCGERGDIERNEYRYFNGVLENYKGGMPADIRKYVRQGYERMERLNRGDWCYIGIRAEAEILLPSGDAGIVQEITSSGLWGVESDSDSEYLADIETDELSSLREQLQAVGFSKRAISAAVNNVARENVQAETRSDARLSSRGQ
jgi:hypothetical protein